MYEILDLKMRRAPSKICASFARLCASSKARNTYLVGDSPDGAVMEKAILRSFSEALAGNGTDISTKIGDLIKREFGFTAQAVDLLDPRYAMTHYTMPPRRGYYRAWDRQSTFFLVCIRPQAVNVEITYRSPFGPESDTLALSVNGARWCNLQIGRSWAKGALTLPSAMLLAGLNEIVVEWPELATTGEMAFGREAERLERGQRCEVFPWFGEVQTLRARGIAVDG